MHFSNGLCPLLLYYALSAGLVGQVNQKWGKWRTQLIDLTSFMNYQLYNKVKDHRPLKVDNAYFKIADNFLSKSAPRKFLAIIFPSGPIRKFCGILDIWNC